MKKIVLALLYVIIFLISGCAQEAPLSETRFFIGTVCFISVYDNKNQTALDEAFKKIEALERLLSANMTETEVELVNRNAGILETHVSAETFEVVKKGLEYSAMSGGTFDITIGPLTSLWRIGSSSATVPDAEDLDKAVGLIDFADVEIDGGDYTVFLISQGMRLDLGAIAKGYIADEAAKVLVENGIGSAIINLGGNVVALGSNGGKAWSIGVRNPLSDADEIVGVIQCADKSIVTSGIYERYFEEGGTRYHHILNPATGYPFDNELASVTIVGESSADCDALSTVAFTKGLSDGLALVEELDGMEAVFITKDMEVYITSGLEKTFNITNGEFTIRR